MRDSHNFLAKSQTTTQKTSVVSLNHFRHWKILCQTASREYYWSLFTSDIYQMIDFLRRHIIINTVIFIKEKFFEEKIKKIFCVPISYFYAVRTSVFLHKIRFSTQNSISDTKCHFWHKITFLTQNFVFDRKFLLVTQKLP